MIGQREYITPCRKLISVCLGQSFQTKFWFEHHYYTQNSKLLVHCKHLIKINGAVGERCQNRSRRKKIRCLGRIVHKLLTQFLWEMMSLPANNNNNLAHGSQPRLAAWFSLSSVFVKLEQTWRSHTHTHTQKKKKKKTHQKLYWKKWQWGRSNASKADWGQINKAFGYFKKMTEEARRQAQSCAEASALCVFRELFLRGKAKSSKAQTEPQSHYF